MDIRKSPEELKKRMNEGHSFVLLDVREPEEHVEEKIEWPQILMPMGEISRRFEAELDRDSEIYVYCAHGIRSLQAALFLKSKGFEKVYSVVGGIEAWHHIQQS